LKDFKLEDDEMKKNGEKPSDLIIIDAQQKASASRA
jgi:hypothetical protein